MQLKTKRSLTILSNATDGETVTEAASNSTPLIDLEPETETMPGNTVTASAPLPATEPKPLPLDDPQYAKFHPSSNYNFPFRKFGQDERKKRLGHSFFKKYPWIHYDTSRDLVFCDTCVSAARKGVTTSTVQRTEKTFTNNGFCCWNDIGRCLQTHQKSEQHREAVTTLHLMATQVPVTAMLDKQIWAHRITNNEQLVITIRALRYLSRQNLALRGATYKKTSVEDISEPDSNLVQVLRLLLEDHPKYRVENLKYLAPSNQNELVEHMGSSVLSSLKTELHRRKFYSIMADETSDISNKEQMCLVIRTVDEMLDAHEDFVGMVDLKAANAETIVTALKDWLVRLELSLEDCRGQCYDGASVMSGCKSGVAATITKENPKALYVHCHAHALNLAVQDCVKQSQSLKESLAICSEICSVIRTSPKRNSMLEQLKIDSGDDNIPGRITSFCPTRWTVRAGTMLKILDNYKYLLELWPLLREETKDQTALSRIIGIESRMKEHSFLFGLLLGIKVLTISDKLSTALQSPKLSAVDAQVMADKTISMLTALRTEGCHADFSAVLEEKVNNLDWTQ